MSASCQTLFLACKHLFFRDWDPRRRQFQRAGREVSGFASGQKVDIFEARQLALQNYSLQLCRPIPYFFCKEMG